MSNPKDSLNRRSRNHEELVLPYQVYEGGMAKVYNIYINEEIKEPSSYTNLLNLLRTASQYDLFTMYINSPGGNLSTGLQLITAMNESPAHIRTCLDGVCASLAPLILFAGREILISDNAMIMFHDFSTGNYGKGSELMSSAEANSKFYKKLLKSYAYPFLSIQEIDQVTKGQDIYFDSDQIIERLEKLNKKTKRKKIIKKTEEK